MSVVNTKAQELANELSKTAEGNPTAIVLDAAMNFFLTVCAENKLSLNTLIEAFLAATETYSKYLNEKEIKTP